MTNDTGKNTTVLIVEDSPTQREVLIALLEEASGFEIVGIACDGLDAVDKVALLRPDIVLMDCHMPRANGFEATRLIMGKTPTPIVMVSSTLSEEEIGQTFDAIKSGALAFLVKPNIGDSHEDKKNAERLIQTLRLMSEVKVVGRRAWPARKWSHNTLTLPNTVPKPKVIAIAGSTGAPGVVADILAAIAGEPLAPILIVQHMAEGFVGGFANWLTTSFGRRVNLAEHGVTLQAGEAYLAPDRLQMGLDSRGRIMLVDAPPEEGFRPSANFLFRSVAEAVGSAAIGILLTGMGRDGATGLMTLRRTGAITIAQDEASCVVFGMPRAAIALGAATHVLNPDEIAQMISLVYRTPKGLRNVQQ